jgi:multimeric flavodoxin WrbA
MIDRLVCADGGNPDPTTTKGKKPELAKALELQGWPYPRHLAGRVFAILVHGDAAGAETLRRSLTDWLTDMHLVPASPGATLDRYVGYYEAYATSHVALDRDASLHEEMRSVAKTLIEAVALAREGRLPRPGDGLNEPRPK